MSGLRAVSEWEDHWPDHGTLVLREAWPGRPEVPALPAGLVPPDELEDPEDTVNGTLALTGAGWFHGTLRADDQPAVRVEVWDGPPREDDEAAWADADLVADLPYWSPVGVVVLNQLVASPGGREIALVGPGPYRIRTWCRPTGGEPAQAWRLQFWPLGDAVPEPARWLRRDWTRPTGTESGWSRYFGDEVEELTSAVWVVAADGPGAAVAELEAHLGAWHPAGFLDQPAGTEAQRARAAGFARELGVPAPRTRRMLLDFLVAAGRLRRTDDGVPRYRTVPDAPRADEVVTLPPEEVAAIAAANAPLVHGYLARDVRAAVLWAPYRLLETTPVELARRLRATPDAVAGALRYLADQGRLAVHGDRADPDAPLTLATDLPDPDFGDPHQRLQREQLLRSAGRPIPTHPIDPAPHLRPPHRHPNRSRPPEPQPAPEVTWPPAGAAHPPIQTPTDRHRPGPFRRP